MKLQLIPRLWIGDAASCQDVPANTAVVHACKHACYVAKCGKVSPDQPHYLSYREGDHLWLNMIDPPKPLFRLGMFEDFLRFAREKWQEGRDLLIHCCKCQSRAPSLALLFLAKTLGRLTDRTYDAAWDEFSELNTLSTWKYQPGAGLEEWLRDNWNRMPYRPLAHVDGAAPVGTDWTVQQREAVAAWERMTAEWTDEQWIDYAQSSPAAHFQSYARFEDPDGNLTPPDGINTPFDFQVKVAMAYEWCIANDVPVRIVIGPKPRQSGASRFTAQLMCHHSKRYRCNAMVIADENSRTDDLWKMVNEMADRDRMSDEDWGIRHDWNQERATLTYRAPDGTAIEKTWQRDTANDPKAGIAGTRHFLWFSEAGRYPKDGALKVTDQQVITNASQSVPDSPGTVIVMESTAEGATGVFFRTVKGAVTLEERMAGKLGNGWIKVFVAWHEVPRYRLARTPETEEWYTLTRDQLRAKGITPEREERGIQLYRWTADQIAWRRQKVASQYDGNEALFDQDYPESEDVAFISSGTPKFNLEGMTRLKIQALTGHDSAYRGTLEEQKGGAVQFIETADVPWLWVKERPMYGARYIAFADCMTGQQSAGSKVRDAHAPGVWRAPYVDQNGTAHGAKLVAAIDVHGGCRWDDDILAVRIHNLSKWYGNCTIAMEVNEALGVLRVLIDRGANLWQRSKQDLTQPGGTSIKIPGWKTTSGATGTRSILVAAMAQFVRDQQGEVCYAPMVAELERFVVYPDGSCAAAPGEHDDWVTGPAIGLACMDAATELRPPARKRPVSVIEEPGGQRGNVLLG